MPAPLLTGLFNALWLLSVAGGNTGALLCLPLEIYWLYQCHNTRRLRILLLGGAGFLFDSLLIITQQLQTPDMPFWLLNIWYLFFMLMPDLLQPLRKIPGLLSLIAAVAAPLAYYAGSQLSDLQATPLAYIIISIFWAMLLPFALDIYHARSVSAVVKQQFATAGR